MYREGLFLSFFLSLLNSQLTFQLLHSGRHDRSEGGYQLFILHYIPFLTYLLASSCSFLFPLDLSQKHQRRPFLPRPSRRLRLRLRLEYLPSSRSHSPLPTSHGPHPDQSRSSQRIQSIQSIILRPILLLRKLFRKAAAEAWRSGSARELGVDIG